MLHAPATGAWFQVTSNAGGTFTNAGGGTWSLGWSVFVTDVNGDLLEDIVLYHPGTGTWYTARNVSLGSFSYTNGTWNPALTVLVRPPIR